MKRAISIRCLAIVLLVGALTSCCPRVSMVDVGPLAAAPSIARLVTAHRGNLHRGILPDNSIPALREAIDAQVPFLEVDVRRSEEGALFLFHDGSLSSSNSNAPRHLRGRSVQSLSQAERASVSLNDNGTIAIPTLAEALALIKDSHSTLQLDLKGESDSLALAVMELVATSNLLDRVLVQIRSTERIALIRSRYPTARILARCLTMEQVIQSLALGVEFVELERWASSEAIAAAHATNTKVLVNVSSSRLDEPMTWEYLRSRGIDSIMSDRADLHS